LEYYRTEPVRGEKRGDASSLIKGIYSRIKGCKLENICSIFSTELVYSFKSGYQGRVSTSTKGINRNSSSLVLSRELIVAIEYEWFNDVLECGAFQNVGRVARGEIFNW
jgi:hypothetical protein